MSEEKNQELVLFEIPQEAVRFDDGKVVTTSHDVAKWSGKDHGKVLRDIRKLLENEAVSSEAIFGLTEYKDEQGKNRPMYSMNRDGFSLLAMGFTGAKAVNFKMAFIRRFNNMEDVLKKILLNGMTLAYENQNRTMLGTVREQECIIHDQSRMIASLNKQNEAHKVVYEFGDAAPNGKLKTEYRRPTHTVARTFSQMQRTIKQLNAEMEQMRFYGLHMEDLNDDSNTGY